MLAALKRRELPWECQSLRVFSSHLAVWAGGLGEYDEKDFGDLEL